MIVPKSASVNILTNIMSGWVTIWWWWWWGWWWRPGGESVMMMVARPRLNCPRPHYSARGRAHVVLQRFLIWKGKNNRTWSIARLWSCKFSTSPQSFSPPTSEKKFHLRSNLVSQSWVLQLKFESLTKSAMTLQHKGSLYPQIQILVFYFFQTGTFN